MPTTADALVTWTKGRPQFTPAGLRHYAAACAEVHLTFVPQAVRSAADLCAFLRSLLQASVALRKADASTLPAGQAPRSPMHALARRALDEVAQTSAAAHCDACMQPGHNTAECDTTERHASTAAANHEDFASRTQAADAQAQPMASSRRG